MNKTTILFVAGEDYSAVDFDRNHNPQAVYDEMKEKGLQKVTIDDTIHIEIKEFDSIDEKFITFIRREMVDYNFAKSTNFYVVKP